MVLSNNLINQFVKATSVKKKEKKEETIYGFVKIDGGKTYVKLDGSELFTPAVTTVNVKDGERVSVKLKNHSAIIDGNLTSPSASSKDVNAMNEVINSQGEKLEIIIPEVNALGGIKDELVTSLHIESSKGNIFKNHDVSTVLSVVIYYGSTRITDADTMKQVFGNSSYLQWKCQRLDDSTFSIISSDDSRIGNDGFSFTIGSKDVNIKVTFMCELIV